MPKNNQSRAASHSARARRTGFSIIDFLKSSRFGAFLLICSTILEGFYAYKLFNITGDHTFEALTFIVSLIYASLITGVIVFFALRNNFFIVWFAVAFEFAMNLLLDVQTVALAKPMIVNWLWIFISQAAIGSILPLSTKAFADEVTKPQRRSAETRNINRRAKNETKTKNKRSTKPIPKSIKLAGK
jgi:hypothetical protein